MLALISVADRIPPDHPLRPIKALADQALAAMTDAFDVMYAENGRVSVPPERLLLSQLLMALFSVRSERQFCEQLQYNLLFRWFLDLDLMEPTFDHSTFSKNRERLLEHEAATRFLVEVVNQARQRGLLSGEHFSVDGTLIQAWASMKSFRRKDDDSDGDSNGWGDFRGEKRSNETHESKTDPEAKLMRKGNGHEAKLRYAAHALMENANGLVVAFAVTEANGRCERRLGKPLDFGAFLWRSRVAICGHHHSQSHVVAPFRIDFGQRAIGRCAQGCENVGAQAHHQDLGFRISKAHVVFYELGTVLRDHQPGE